MLAPCNSLCRVATDIMPECLCAYRSFCPIGLLSPTSVWKKIFLNLQAPNQRSLHLGSLSRSVIYSPPPWRMSVPSLSCSSHLPLTFPIKDIWLLICLFLQLDNTLFKNTLFSTLCLTHRYSLTFIFINIISVNEYLLN